MATITPRSYDPRAFKALTFHSATAGFRNGKDTPRNYLERCLETIAAREPGVKAFVVRNDASARSAADASSARWKAGAPLSAIDGMPIAIKDLLETKDMPTEMGCDAYRGKKRSATMRRCGHCAKRVLLFSAKPLLRKLVARTPALRRTHSNRPAHRAAHRPARPLPSARAWCPQHWARRLAAPSFARLRSAAMSH
jgi:hypothetical protein